MGRHRYEVTLEGYKTNVSFGGVPIEEMMWPVRVWDHSTSLPPSLPPPSHQRSSSASELPVHLGSCSPRPLERERRQPGKGEDGAWLGGRTRGPEREEGTVVVEVDRAIELTFRVFPFVPPGS